MRGQALRISLTLPPHPAAATFSPAGRRSKWHPLAQSAMRFLKDVDYDVEF
ncbi:hypothetical protein L901_25200 [Agrobacterium sp. D14]|nr:hypothetical protein L902_11150 [Agrobacterium radiobacter DSM 30147]KVK44959.1 hypothetical protein L904_26570 [Agrobacterium sp. LY4]KVK45004.1 hypothetical protein L903_26595 [Agrobacterium sp. JL28]KVK45843.1 hypothetical protein L901_25200 [Agrobacterium sp. D14]